MADVIAQQPIKIKRRIGGTTHIVTSHFQKEGSTDKDKTPYRIGINIKSKRLCKRLIFDIIFEIWYNNHVERNLINAVTAGNGGQNG